MEVFQKYLLDTE